MNSQTIHEAVKLIEELIRDREDLALRLEGVEAHRERLLEDARKRDAAVPSLPDVDPSAFWIEGGVVRDEQHNMTWNHRDQAAEFAASALHALTLFDAEAADHTHNDEEQRAFVSEAVDVMGSAQTQRPADLAGALYRAGFRARNGQEESRG